MTTGRMQITETAALYEWDALESPWPHEVIYQRGPMLVFAQYDKEGKFREGQLRQVLRGTVTKQVAVVGWDDPRKLVKAQRWLSDYGLRAEDERELRRRSRARRAAG